MKCTYKVRNPRAVMTTKYIRAPDSLRALYILVANAKLYLTASRAFVISNEYAPSGINAA